MGRRRTIAPPRRSPARAVVAAGLALVALVALPGLVLAHPLGNFTINHYAGVRIERDRVFLDVVIDEAEIPAFEAKFDVDVDGDGQVSAAEIDAGRVPACTKLAGDLRLTAGERTLALELARAGLAFPAGTGGLATMRTVCEFSAALPAALTPDAPTRIAFVDTSFAGRLGWREIVATGSGATLSSVEGAVRSEGVSARLTAYPKGLLASALADSALVVDAVSGGPDLPVAPTPDALPVPGASTAPSTAPSSAPAEAASDGSIAAVGAVPGGVGGGDLPSIFRTADLTPVVLLVSLLTAVALGAGHALTPGHGKTLMAAYLVGTRGTPLHALGLGLSVSLSHTIGILVLAGLVVGASDVLAPDVVVRAAPAVAAVSIVAIGGWMLASEWRRRRAAAASATLEHPHAHRHEPSEEHRHPHEPQHDELAHGHEAASGGVLEHHHGGVAHTHLPAIGSTISWRSLFLLGLAGGLIPSTSALLILLGSIAAGRPGFGFVLVVAFGLGMAGVMAGIGLVLVVARGRLDRMPSGRGMARLRDAIPLVAAVLVFSLGIYLTAQAVAGAPTL
jgi:ABC-type nickel/cobalt efflux system permease component RcnA